jgi:hypothetical protein
VDAVEEDQLLSRPPLCREDEVQKWDPEHEQAEGDRPVGGVTKVKKTMARDRMMMTAQTAMSSGECSSLPSRRIPLTDWSLSSVLSHKRHERKHDLQCQKRCQRRHQAL